MNYLDLCLIMRKSWFYSNNTPGRCNWRTVQSLIRPLLLEQLDLVLHSLFRPICPKSLNFYVINIKDNLALTAFESFYVNLLTAALTYLFKGRLGTNLYRQIVGILMGTTCAPLIADLFLFCYERDFMASLSSNKEAEIIQAFNSSARSLDDLLNIDNLYFEQMVGRIYLPEFQLNKTNASDTEALFFWIYIYVFQTGLFHPKL